MTTRPAPKKIGRYQILQELGRGAMGVVYKALDPALDRTVAIKTILLSGDAEERASFEARFVQEARAAGRLSHPAIVTIYDVGREGELAYMAMELLSGTELRSRMRRTGMPLAEALDIAAQVAEGMAFAHAHGVVHRDIKPGNIMIANDGRARIMDFGIARMSRSDVKTETGVLLGTPKYMSPEQIAGGTLDHRADVFSLGAVLYEMVTGRPPFTGPDTTSLMHNIASSPHMPASWVVSSLPDMVDLILMRALEKDPAARYQSASELAADLRACLLDLSAQPAPAAATGDAGATLASAPGADTEGTAAETVATQRPGRAPGAAVPAFWAVSRAFDSTVALGRIAALAAGDRGTLDRVPRPATGLERLRRDTDLRLFALVVLVAALLAAAILGI